MTKFKAERADADQVCALLRELGYPAAETHTRSDLLTVTTSEADHWPLTRFRRLSASMWQLEMPTHTARWQPTPFRASLEALVRKVVEEFSWTIEEARAAPVRTSDLLD